MRLPVYFCGVKKSILIVVFLILVRPVLPVADYIINYDYITRVLCVNKAKPMLHCNGKCHLMKELAKTAEQDKPLNGKKNHPAETEVLFFQPVASFSFKAFIYPVNKDNTTQYSNLYSYINAVGVLHPPTYIS